MSIDVERARADTPACERVTHLNHAGASLPPRQVLDAQVEWLRAEAETGGYELADQRADDRQRTYDEVAALLGAGNDEIALVENATFAWHQAFWSLPLRPGDRILTCTVEYASSYVSYLQAQRRRGVAVEVIPDDEHGQVSIDALARLLDDGDAGGGDSGRGPVGLVAVTHVPTNGGVVNPVEDVGRLCRAAGVPFLLDACQSVGQLPVDVEAVGCDFLAATGRKFLRAPRGIGFLYARRSRFETMDPAFLDLLGAEWVAPDRYELRPDARRFENWESNQAAIAGLREAVAYARSWGLDAIADRVGHLAEALRARLADVPGVAVHDLGTRRSGIVTFTKDGHPAGEIKEALAGQGINVSVSEPSSTRLDADRRHLPPLVRASVHYLTTEAELDRVTAAVAAI
jgi:cysteine desulfurase / selenocysteine lyase